MLNDFPDDWDKPLETLLRLPARLRAIVPFVHARSGIREDPTAESLAAIDKAQTSVEDRVRHGLREYWDKRGRRPCVIFPRLSALVTSDGLQSEGRCMTIDAPGTEWRSYVDR